MPTSEESSLLPSSNHQPSLTGGSFNAQEQPDLLKLLSGVLDEIENDKKHIKLLEEKFIKNEKELSDATKNIIKTADDLTSQKDQIKRTQDLAYLGFIVLIVMVATLVIDALKDNKTSIIYQLQQPEYENQSRQFRK